MKNDRYVRYERIAEGIKKVISESYAFIESLEDVVKGLYISAGYANRIFKKQTGMSIFTYLVQEGGPRLQ